MTVRGTVKNGQIEIPQHVNLPEGTEVVVLVEQSPVDDFTLSDLAIDTDLPQDLAEEHDHYLYGTPKRTE